MKTITTTSRLAIVLAATALGLPHRAAADGSSQSPIDWNAGDPVLQLQRRSAEASPEAAAPSDYCRKRYSAETRTFMDTGRENEVIGGGLGEVESQIDYLADVSGCKDERGMPLADRPLESVELWGSGYGGKALAMICADRNLAPQAANPQARACTPEQSFSYSLTGNWWVAGRAVFPSVRVYGMGADAVYVRDLRIVPTAYAVRIKRVALTFREYPMASVARTGAPAADTTLEDFKAVETLARAAGVRGMRLRSDYGILAARAGARPTDQALSRDLQALEDRSQDLDSELTELDDKLKPLIAHAQELASLKDRITLLSDVLLSARNESLLLGQEALVRRDNFRRSGLALEQSLFEKSLERAAAAAQRCLDSALRLKTASGD